MLKSYNEYPEYVLSHLLDSSLELPAELWRSPCSCPPSSRLPFDRTLTADQGNLKTKAPEGSIFQTCQWLLTRAPVPRHNRLYRRAHLRGSHGVHLLPVSLRSLHLLMLIWLLPSDLIRHANLHSHTTKSLEKGEGQSKQIPKNGISLLKFKK